MTISRFVATVTILLVIVDITAIHGTGQSSSQTSTSVNTSRERGWGKTAVRGTGIGNLRGKISYDGTPPEPKEIADIQSHPDRDHCLKGTTKDALWLVNANGGVANVVIWLKPPRDKFFDVFPEARTRADNVVLDQPFCTFIPRVAAIYPSYFDMVEKRQKRTGQTLEIRNSAPRNHCTTWAGNPLFNPGNSVIIPANRGKVQALQIEVWPCNHSDAGAEDLLKIHCDCHRWMSGSVAVFDHPYYAVTDEKGEFEIKNAPAGAEVTLAYWHESMGSLKAARKQPMTLREGENRREFRLKAE